MREAILAGIRERVAAALAEWGATEVPVTVEVPPSPELGDLALPTALSLARVRKKNPREIAAELVERLQGTEGVRRAEIAGPGYINLFLDRRAYLRRALEERRPATTEAAASKTIIEHTNINPNKAAHIGHLRNAILGDALARCLRFLGDRVEVQNYIDDTGVQVADLVVGFQHLRKMSLDDIKGIRERFDYYCWDLYAEVTAYYAEDPERTKLRSETLRHMEEGKGRTAEMAAFLADRIMRAHLRTMGRLGIRYNLLPRESDVLAHRFWEAAFERLQAARAIDKVESGEKAGCWTMLLPPESGRQEEEKILVRSNGTVTYVGKDIAYQMWKFGLLGVDFEYLRTYRYEDGSLLHVTTRPGGGESNHPEFGRGHTVINVIDVRQSYLQRVVAEALRRLGHREEAERSIHFHYEMVALTPACAREMGIAVSEEDAARPYLEMSGRRGHGVKADDLIDRLIEKAVLEVRARGLAAEGEVDSIAAAVAIGALKYFMLRYVRNRVVAFDFSEVLSFEGETGPYVQYAVVRAGNILARVRERHGVSTADLRESIRLADMAYLEGDEGTEHWQLVVEATRLREIAEQARTSLELSVLAKHHFMLAQRFNAWYHKYRVVDEEREGIRHLRVLVTHLFRREMRRGLALMGIDVPSRM